MTSKNKITVEGDLDKDIGTQKAAMLLRPSLQGGYALANLHAGTEGVELDSFVHALVEQIEEMQQGDNSRLEAMLLTQAHTLNSLFNQLTVKAFAADYVSQLETYLKLALKAQSQTRATITALSEIKNPKQVAYVQQANIAAGNQQVNNNGVNDRHGGTDAQNNSANPAARKNQKAPNKLMDATKGNSHEQQWLDRAAPQEAIRTDKEVETLETVNRG